MLDEADRLLEMSQLSAVLALHGACPTQASGQHRLQVRYYASEVDAVFCWYDEILRENKN